MPEQKQSRMELWINPRAPSDVALRPLFEALYPGDLGKVEEFKWLTEARFYNGQPGALASGAPSIRVELEKEHGKRAPSPPPDSLDLPR